MSILNVTPDSFWEPSRVTASTAAARMELMVAGGADIIDIGAVSTRPGAAPVDVEEEWARLRPVLEGPARDCPARISIDTTSSIIVDRAAATLGKPFIINDISAGEDDPAILPLAGRLGMTFVAMHKRGNPRTMDSLTDYPEGVVQAVLDYFDGFALKAAEHGIADWILDPGFGFAKTDAENVELLEGLQAFKRFGRPILVGLADKRFVRARFSSNAEAHALAIRGGADILRIHDFSDIPSETKAPRRRFTTTRKG